MLLRTCDECAQEGLSLVSKAPTAPPFAPPPFPCGEGYDRLWPIQLWPIHYWPNLVVWPLANPFCVMLVLCVVVVVVCVCCCCRCGCWFGHPLPWTTLRRTAQMLFSLSCHNIHSFFSSLGVFSWNLGGVFEDWDRQMCTFGLSGCGVKPRDQEGSVDTSCRNTRQSAHPEFDCFRQIHQKFRDICGYYNDFKLRCQSELYVHEFLKLVWSSE